MMAILQQMVSEEHVKHLYYSELDIKADVLEDYIGFSPGNVPDPFPQIIEEIFHEFRKVKVRGGYIIFDGVKIDRQSKEIIFHNTVFGAGNTVTRHLAKSTYIAIFACTAGSEVTSLASEYNRKGKSVHAYIADSLGSIVVERAMDIIHEGLQFSLKKKGLQITNRYSPGYCNWDIRDQKKLFDLIPENFCGITLSDSMLMKPIKSISGFMGIGREVSFDKYTCHFCKDKNCPYRNKR